MGLTEVYFVKFMNFSIDFFENMCYFTVVKWQRTATEEKEINYGTYKKVSVRSGN